MPTNRQRFSWRGAVSGALLLMAMVLPGTQLLAGEQSQKSTPPPLGEAFSKVTPDSLDDLKAIQNRVQWVVKKVMPAVVGVRIGAGQGSGVIVSEDGYILTAAHVSGPPGRKVTIILPDGKEVRGKTLGTHRGVDAGMIKITTKGKWPFAKMGKSQPLKRGNWCVAIGHPGGHKPGRDPVVRLGRILDNLTNLIRSDCTLVGGDSGGPLFDMHGQVIGIHSRIGSSIIFNIHVPVHHYTKDWDDLVKGELLPLSKKAWLGVEGDVEAKECRIIKVVDGSPADKAGLKVDDVVIRFGKNNIDTFDDLANAVSGLRPGARVEVEVRRGDEKVTLNLRLGRRPPN